MWPLKLSMMRKTLRPETWRSNPLNHFRKKFPRHPSTGVVPVLAPKRVLVYVLEMARVLILSNDPKWEHVATISIAADGKR
jgi:hypothetical protein